MGVERAFESLVELVREDDEDAPVLLLVELAMLDDGAGCSKQEVGLDWHYAWSSRNFLIDSNMSSGGSSSRSSIMMPIATSR